MNRSKHTGRTCGLLAKSGLVAAFLAGTGAGMVAQNAHADGFVRCWGRNTGGQCNTPADLGPCSSVAGGSSHTIALRSDGFVRCWGRNNDGQCNPPGDLGPCSSVAGGSYHTIALRIDGSVRCWGDNGSGQPAGLGPCSKIAGGGYHTIALAGVDTDSDGRVDSLDNCPTIANPTQADCNSDGVGDVCEIAAGTAFDCNTNTIPDSCDAANDLLEDCNNNGLGDTCEKELTLALHSGHLSPIGFNANQTWAIPSAVRAASPVTLVIHGHGDFSGLQEYVRVKVGSGFDEHALQSTTDCENPGTPSISTFTLPPQQFNAAIGADGAIRVVMEPSIAVDPAGCNGGTWIEASLDYIGARPADCNANGLLDSCEIAAGYSPDSNQNGVIDTCESLLLDCPTDFNQSGSTDGADLGILLAAWGATGQSGVDLNHDGIINGADLGQLLSNWGACAN